MASAKSTRSEKREDGSQYRPARKKRRVRSPHPGVVLIPPDKVSRHPYWRARFKDPDTGKLTKVRLDPTAITTAEARREWAIRKSKALAKRSMEIEAGAPVATGTALEDAVARYFRDHPQLRAKTLAAYRGAANKLLAWAQRHGVKSADELTRAKLLAFRADLAKEGKTAPITNGQRGKREATTKPRSPHTVNRELRSVNTVLRYLADVDLLPKASHDDLRRAFKRSKAPVERMAYLKPADCQRLLEAALRHDAETFRVTREEHDAGTSTHGKTPRYEAIAPMIAATLLTGMRLGEVLALEWDQVDLDALDGDGRKVGEIHLKGADNKTHQARTVDLAVSPSLRALLAALKLRTGGKGSVLGLSQGVADAAAKRLKKDYGAPESFSWQALRRTCGTYLTNAPGIFGAASAYRSARQLGHSVTVAERHYVGVERGVPRDATTLEAAMQIEGQMARVIAAAGGASHPLQTAIRNISL